MPYINRKLTIRDERLRIILTVVEERLRYLGYPVPTEDEAREVLFADWVGTDDEVHQDYLDHAPAEEIADFLTGYWTEIQNGRWRKRVHDDGDRWIMATMGNRNRTG